MVKVVSTKNAISMTERTWKNFNVTQKKALLKALGHSLTWAKAKTIREMVDRGGGMVANDLLRVTRRFKQKRKDVKRVIFR